LGLIWCVQPHSALDKVRTISLEQLWPWLPTDCDYYCLQKEIREVDKQFLPKTSIREYTDSFLDFGETAGLCSLMDLVISVDTSMAHLSAALGRPTWILLANLPDWRWLLHTRTSPWYESVKLFRQNKSESWDTVLPAVHAELQAFIRLLNTHS
ncbi:MAG: glycosyltransferase family 9 protein, partial [Gammaproteobacteria bacterium]|nr:glycosyltransferase family 9 protein [Gammaproteobacteria bacterium]